MPRYRKGESKVAGLREQRRSKMTGTLVSIYNAEEADIDTDGGPWVTVCEDHNTVCSHATLALARHHLPTCEWCEDCQTATEAKMTMSKPVQVVRYANDHKVAKCYACDKSVVWANEDDTVGDLLCQDGDAVLFADCGCCAAGARISGIIYCDDCTPAVLHERCQKCQDDQHHAVEAMTEVRMIQSPNPTVATVAKQNAMSTGGRIEVVDVAALPVPPPGSWAAQLRESLLKTEKGQN